MRILDDRAMQFSQKFAKFSKELGIYKSLTRFAEIPAKERPRESVLRDVRILILNHKKIDNRNNIMHKNTSKKGFTLVEIMIVVVIIGLLAAMAIPAFQKVRENSRASAMDNDARQIASGAQQFMLENNVTTVAVGYVTADGTLGAALTEYVKQIGKSYTVSANIAADATFSISHVQANPSVRVYNSEGQLQ